MINRTRMLARRLDLKLSQETVAARAGISREAYSRLENGKADLDKASYGTICSIMRALDIEVTEEDLPWWQSYNRTDWENM